MKVNLLVSVHTFLLSLAPKELAKSIKTIELLEEFENTLGMPHSKYIENGLLELRVRSTREIRIFYTFHKQEIYLLHAFIKKTQKTPSRELRVAQSVKEKLL